MSHTEIGAAGPHVPQRQRRHQHAVGRRGHRAGHHWRGAQNGGLTITGNGSPQSGGIIQRKTGADGLLTAGVGISLVRTRNPSFSWMDLFRFDNWGIVGREVSGFSLLNSAVVEAGNATGLNEGPVSFGTPGPAGVDGLAGTGVIRNSLITEGVEDNVAFYNRSGSMDLTVDRTTPTPGGCQISTNAVSTGRYGLVVALEDAASASVTVDKCRFRDNRTIGLLATAADDTSLTVTVTGSPTDGTLQPEFVRTVSGQVPEGIVVTQPGQLPPAWWPPSRTRGGDRVRGLTRHPLRSGLRQRHGPFEPPDDDWPTRWSTSWVIRAPEASSAASRPPWASRRRRGCRSSPRASISSP
ncbi:MAG: hypothetical protein R2712_22640 [Vicinamibacterales bacterium]